ncbi:hypothetical protein IEQ34_021312 [Dendrobium chrysotoxum]|uniref:Uncharacterized protein n=1 Tax=Dendrobium chrysotoxum TaxID=161865 RepID=A0AAV7G4E1_DENCH|nr:hypothetical protein IEQ34_021312 [Dendrobium chrysotoxum]
MSLADKFRQSKIIYVLLASFAIKASSAPDPFSKLVLEDSRSKNSHQTPSEKLHIKSFEIATKEASSSPSTTLFLSDQKPQREHVAKEWHLRIIINNYQKSSSNYPYMKLVIILSYHKTHNFIFTFKMQLKL